MELKPIGLDPGDYPEALGAWLSAGRLYDSSCSPDARVLFIDRDGGYFLKMAPVGALERECELTRYFHTKGLAAKVLLYTSDLARDYLLTEKVPGEDCLAEKYLDHPQRLCDLLAERLFLLHSMDCADCPVQDHTERYLARVEQGRAIGRQDRSFFPGGSPGEAWALVEEKGHLLQDRVLLHGDYCLPNVILNDWKFSGFVDLDSGGVGDRHVDLFWGAWTLRYNLKTDRYRRRFFDAYGRGLVDEDKLRLVAACEVFG